MYCVLALPRISSIAIIVNVTFLPAALLNKLDFAFQVCCDTELYWKIPQHHIKGVCTGRVAVLVGLGVQERTMPAT